jgi:hypothetical protein
VIGGALVIPAGLLAKLMGALPADQAALAIERTRIERLAMQAVMSHERSLGFIPRDVAADKLGYDVESQVLGTGKLRFIEVKGRAMGAETVTLTKNEILTALNKPEEFILALVAVDGAAAHTPQYVRRPFTREPDFGVTSVTYDLSELLAKVKVPK